MLKDSNLKLTVFGMQNKDIKQIFILDEVLQSRVSLVPSEIYYLLHIASFLWNLSSIPSHTTMGLKEAPKGKTKVGRQKCTCLAPKL